MVHSLLFLLYNLNVSVVGNPKFLKSKTLKSTGLLFFVFLYLSTSTLFASLDDNINALQTQGNLGVDLNRTGNNEQVAVLVINSNYAAGFHITFTFTNKGKFKKGSKEITMTNIVLNKMNSGTLGTGLSEPVNLTMLPLDGSGSWVWSPGTPTTETINYVMEIKVSWSSPGSGNAGFYFENINAVISVGP